MAFTGTWDGLSVDLSTNKQKLSLTVNEDVREVYNKFKDCDNLDITIKKHRHKRSLDANNYMWLLLSKLAAIQHTTKEELYYIMLERYGTFYYLPVEEGKEQEIQKVFRIVHDRGETTLTTPSGKQVTCRQLQCYKGSSLYNTKEMSVLIDGVVQEAQDAGIDTITPAELSEMKQKWGVDLAQENESTAVR